MDCIDVMKAPVVVADPDDSLRHAAALMRDANVGFLPVCTSAMKPIGVITDRDIVVRGIAAGLLEDARVADVMSEQVVCVDQRAPLAAAEDLMARHHKSRVLCVDEGGSIVGVISLSDLPGHEDAERTQRTLAEVTAREARP